MTINNAKFNKETVNFFRFKKFGGKILLTNDIGQYLFLTPRSFDDFIAGKLKKNNKAYQELEEKGFIRNRFNLEKFAQQYRRKNAFLTQGPSLFIIVNTLKCNHRCLYCQASSAAAQGKKYDMTVATAKKVVDLIFKTKSPVINIEFQGGEPLMNWPVLKYIVQYAKKKNTKTDKKLSMTAVSNLSLLDDKKYKFLTDNGVSLSTSLDGPEALHNKNRLWKDGNSYKKTAEWLKKSKAGAILTVSKYSLAYPKEIIDEYLKLGLKEVHLRPLSYLGLSGKLKDQIGYPMKDFIDFWKKSMDYIISLNVKGKLIQERETKVMLQKILAGIDPNYAELRSPCGAVTGQLAFNFDGKVYTCDEGRMIEGGIFMVGDAKKDSYQKIVNHPTSKTLCMASLLENLPCDNCAYKPYCGVCPVQNYAIHNDLFPQLANNERCQFHTFAFDYLFHKLENKLTKGIFGKWLGLH